MKTLSLSLRIIQLLKRKYCTTHVQENLGISTAFLPLKFRLPNVCACLMPLHCWGSFWKWREEWTEGVCAFLPFSVVLSCPCTMQMSSELFLS